MTGAPRLVREGADGLALAAVLALAAGSLLCFADKAVHVDDPLILWSAEQIARAPFDPYGVSVNWYGWDQPLAEVAQNPPLASYWAAAAFAIGGGSERALHLAFFVPALLALAGTWLLARDLGARPALAAFSLLGMPAFFVASTSLMCDVLLLAAFVWSVLVWRRGIERSRAALLVAGALLAGLASLAKYFGIALLPLLAGYALLRRRRAGSGLLVLALPIAMLVGWEVATRSLYGQGHLSQALFYSTKTRMEQEGAVIAQILVALAFSGGALLSALFFAPLRFAAPALIAFAAAGVAGALALPATALPGQGWQTALALRAQFAVFGVGGVAALALGVRALARWRDPDRALLGAWVVGTFAFAALVNWTANVRSLAPAAPALAILIASAPLPRARRAASEISATCAALAVVWLVAWADCRVADSARTAATQLGRRHAGGARPLWFEGHWGFQWYAQRSGARPLSILQTSLVPGDKVMIPSNNTNWLPLPAGTFEVADFLEIGAAHFLTTMSQQIGAGFHASVLGPLPWVLGDVPPDQYVVLRVTRPIPAPIAGRRWLRGRKPD